MTNTPITAGHTIGEWLEHPTGGPAIREMLAASGTDEGALGPALTMPLQQLVALSGGQMPQSVVDDLLRAANGGELPEASGLWVERITPGRFDGQSVVITGAGGGIGLTCAQRVVAEGGRVIAVDIDGAKLTAARDAMGQERFVPLALDLTAPDAAQQVLGAADGPIDALANVAGINDDFAPLHEVDDDVWQRVFAVNVDAVMRLTRAVLPGMLEARRGSVVIVTSEAGLRGGASGAAYTASKHAVIGLTKSCAFMYARDGVRVNALAPGGVATGIPMQGTMSEFGTSRLAPARVIMPGIADAAQLAASTTFLLSDDSTNINGAVLTSDGGWSAA
ncbi:SDR family NAD(P)-dependent oxidoreductase [Dermacoccus nishinomiyaensis]|uniref:SDR family NAD(P)-dependent oxidoreductase n=1 Tax=Dermacoccus nishinomiyaensis TaxID=1274 RepID=UPI00093C265A|nr:SDR family NAD(P)-dependent oxidoreductase [Dermacoccus nishinomiyaensis]